ncbi:HNH endonuclease [Staphylococcus pseudintermedius]|nr:HNH endonuclease [Staphylococcus pseudintermedius]EIW3383813.1 HNH endonuclease [Staphylococcus pseudintermedius]EKC6405491.1 HNH endonuclease [Staphylococcus pseudintermedius]
MIKILELSIGKKVLVHSEGKIETLDHKNIRKNGRIDNRKGRILKPKIDKYGYEVVTLTANGKRKSYTVHKLVAKAFIENKENKPTVNHIDGDKRNNNYKNLEWATHKEQKEHSLINNLSSLDPLMESNKKRSIEVVFRGKRYNSIKQASRENRVHERVVKREGVMPNEQPCKNT